MIVSNEGRKAVVLLSGGLDSATTAAIARKQGFVLYALSFRYGQRHAIEIEAAQRVADFVGVEQHVIQTIDLRVFGGSALTGKLEVPKSNEIAEIGSGIPVTYVPARNTIFLSFALYLKWRFIPLPTGLPHVRQRWLPIQCCSIQNQFVSDKSLPFLTLRLCGFA